jgi:putative DNA methylase
MEALKQRIAMAGAYEDVPSLIEKIWPVQKISVEAQKERKANLGQTLTGLGSYWKGRKPLVLARACVLGALLPSTGDEERDLAIFEMLMGMAENQVDSRFKVPPTIEEIERYGEPEGIEQLIETIEQNGETTKRLRKLNRDERTRLMCNVVRRMPYALRVTKLLRPEEVPEELLIGPILPKIAEQLGESASSLSALIEALGRRRFGRRPRVADTFAGGGSLPFEAARLGADVYASDLNPIACLLTWGALHVIGADEGERKRLEESETRLISAVTDDIEALGIEEDEHGNRAKAYLYCVEARCPQTEWTVPLATSWAVSKSRNVIARLVPDRDAKRFDIEIVAGVSNEDLAEADKGTVREGKIVYSLGDQTYSTPIKTLRGDRTSLTVRPATTLDLGPKMTLLRARTTSFRNGSTASSGLPRTAWIRPDSKRSSPRRRSPTESARKKSPPSSGNPSPTGRRRASSPICRLSSETRQHVWSESADGPTGTTCSRRATTSWSLRF